MTAAFENIRLKKPLPSFSGCGFCQSEFGRECVPDLHFQLGDLACNHLHERVAPTFIDEDQAVRINPTSTARQLHLKISFHPIGRETQYERSHIECGIKRLTRQLR